MWHYLRGRNISLKVNFLEIHLPVRFFCGWGATAQRVKAFAQLKPWHHLKWQTHLSLPMTAALLGEGQRQRISRACWPSLAKMLSFHFSEKQFLKFWCSALRSTCLCCHRHEPQTHTHTHPPCQGSIPFSESPSPVYSKPLPILNSIPSILLRMKGKAGHGGTWL